LSAAIDQASRRSLRENSYDANAALWGCSGTMYPFALAIGLLPDDSFARTMLIKGVRERNHEHADEEVMVMMKRLRVLGIVLAVFGFGFVVAGGVAYAKVQDGYDSLQAFSKAQNVTLNYNEQGQLTDRGTTEGAQAIMSLLKNDWKYPVVGSDLDPKDPLVNTATEYMYQMATVVYHTLHGTQTVTLKEDAVYEGKTYAAGTYEFPVDGRYWTGFDRQHPIEGPAREQAWTGTAHALVGELGVGTVTHSTLQMGLAMAGLFAGLGLVFMVAGGGLVFASRGRMTRIPDTIPEAFVTETTLGEVKVNATAN
jgi:hypothetical protein